MNPHPRTRATQNLPKAPLAILRALVVFMAVLGSVDMPPLGVPQGLHWTLIVAVVLSVVCSLWRPVVGAALAALLLGMVAVVGNHGYEVYPLTVATVLVVALEAPATVVVTLGAFLGLEAFGTSGKGSPETAAALAGTTLVCAAIGLGVRALLHRARVVEDRIGELERQALAVRRDERAALADDLSTLLTETLSDKADELLAASRADDLGVSARATLAGVEAAAEASLAQLRTLVSTLRGGPGGAAGLLTVPAVEPLGVAEDVEEVLAGHGFHVELHIQDLPDGLPRYALDTANTLLREAGAVIPRLGAPGSTCQLSVEATPDALTAAVGVPLNAGALASAAPLVGALSARVDAVGGTLVEERRGAEWTARLVLPLGKTPDAPAPATLRRTGWRSRAPWLAVDSWAPVAILGVGTALNTILTLVAFATGDPRLPIDALWALTYLGLVFLINRPTIGIALEVFVLALGLALGQPTLLIGQPPQLAIFGLAAWASTRATRWPLGVVVGWIAYCAAWFRGGLTPIEVASAIAYPLFGIAFGLAIRHFLQLRRAQLAAFGSASEAFQDARALERRQLAGELHDIVAHQLSLITMQVMANGSSEDPAVLSTTIRRVASINRSAQADLAMLLHLLRDGEARPGKATDQGPRMTPSGALAGVKATLEGAGHTIEVTLDPDVDTVDPTTQRTLTRILREASTNILRYAPPRSHCQIALVMDPQNVDLNVTSPLRDRTPKVRHSTGTGLLGLTERIRLTGGTFSAGPQNGRWHVQARLFRAAQGV